MIVTPAHPEVGSLGHLVWCVSVCYHRVCWGDERVHAGVAGACGCMFFLLYGSPAGEVYVALSFYL